MCSHRRKKQRLLLGCKHAWAPLVLQTNPIYVCFECFNVCAAPVHTCTFIGLFNSVGIIAVVHREKVSLDAYKYLFTSGCADEWIRNSEISSWVHKPNALVATNEWA